MSMLAGEWIAPMLKLALGTAAFAWILWTVRAVDSRAVGMMLTFPALNGVVLLTVTDKAVSEMVVGIVPMMFFNGLLAILFVAARRALGGVQWLAVVLCLAVWAALAAVLEWDAVRAHRWAVAYGAGLLVLMVASLAFVRLRARRKPAPVLPQRSASVASFLRERAPRIFLFFVSLLIVSIVAQLWRDAHSLVGRLSALPLVPLFVLHFAVNERRVDLGELGLAAMIGPVAAGGFLLLFAATLAPIRTEAGALHPAYWPVGVTALLLEWELTRRAILGLSRLSHRG